MNWELVAALAGVAGVAGALGGAFLNFVISVSVKLGKLETRVDTVERDQDNLGALYRNQKTDRRSA